jgi:DNA end-binding protein Ku
MLRAERIGLGRWVFHNREYLVAIRPLDQVLALHTMRFADELVGADSLDLPAPSRKPSRREVQMARTLVDSLNAAFEPGKFADSYRERVFHLLEAKARGEEPELPDAPESDGDTDLTAALTASLAGR